MEEKKRKLAADLRAEVVAAEMVEQGIAPDKVMILPVGQFKRGYHRDVLDVKEQSSEKAGQPILSIPVNRDGLYDYLPEGLFHEHYSPDFPKSLKRSTEAIRTKETQEQEARKFFSAFESAFYFQRILLELEERKSLRCFAGDEISQLFFDFWGLPFDSFRDEQSVLLSLMPLSYRFAGNDDLAAKCMEAVLGIKVCIKRGSVVTYDLGDEFSPVLGSTTLGLDFVLGGSLNDGMPALELFLGPVTFDDIHGYLPGGRKQKILAILCDIFLPVDMDVKVTILLVKESESFVLSEDQNYARLGYSSVL